METTALSGEEAASLFEADPSRVGFPLGMVCRIMEMSKQELLVELQSGRLVATAVVTQKPFRYQDVFISGDNFLKWLVLRFNDNPEFQKRVLRDLARQVVH